MATSVLVPLSEYLNSSYQPDREYVDGELKERSVGERPHTQLQIILGAIFRNNRKEWRVVAMGDQRVQVNETRYRVPDVCVVRSSDPPDDIVRVAPLVCIEILSKGDSISSLQERVDDYLSMGVENVWAIDPWKRLAYYASRRKFEQPEDGVLRVQGTAIKIVLADVFAELDEV